MLKLSSGETPALFVDIRQGKVRGKMSAGKVLQPVLKMKVDEVFLCWLSDTSTQSLLKSYLKRTKNGETIDLGECGVFGSSTETGKKHVSSSSLNKLDTVSGTHHGAMCSPPSQLLSNLSLSPLGSPRSGCGTRVRRSAGSYTCYYVFLPEDEKADQQHNINLIPLRRPYIDM